MTIERSGDIYHDSGSNRHVFYDKSSFTEYQHIPPIKVNGFGDNLSTAAVGRGSVVLSSGTDQRIKRITLTNVLHVPAAHANLLSQIRLDRKGIGATLKEGRVVLFKTADGSPIVHGTVHNDMYRLDLRIVAPDRPTPSPTVNAIHSLGFYTA